MDTFGSTSARAALDRFLGERDVDDVADGAFLAGIAMIERACERARESVDFRWRSNAFGELRALRRSLKLAVDLCTAGAMLREIDDERWDARRPYTAADMVDDLQPGVRRRNGVPS